MKGLSPTRWANDLSVLLNQVLGNDRFPVDVAGVAKEISHNKFPDDPISVVVGRDLPGFDGALFRAPPGKKGWGIFYNSAISARGRINFTLAHEFGHYLLHRLQFPNGIECKDDDVVQWDSDYRRIEAEANVFAANLLMPLDDYRRQISATSKVDLDMISACADRYRVSLVAAVLRWLQYTERRAILVQSNDGFIKWARSSDRALKTGAYFATSKKTIAVPEQSLAGLRDKSIDGRAGIELPAGVWLDEAVHEMTIFADQYDFAITLLLLGNDAPSRWN